MLSKNCYVEGGRGRNTFLSFLHFNETTNSGERFICMFPHLHTFGLCRQHVVISISSTPPPPSFLCKVTRGVSAFLILQYPVSFTKVSLLSCREAGLKILVQPVCTGPDVQHTVIFKSGNKILLWIRSCSSQYQNCSCTSVLKVPSFLVTFHIIENEVYLSS